MKSQLLPHVKVKKSTPTMSPQKLIENGFIYAKTAINSLDQPFLLLDEKFTILYANKTYDLTFKSSTQNSVGLSLYSISGGAWNIPGLKKLLKTVLLDNAGFFKGFEVKKDFGNAGKKLLVVSARRIYPAIPIKKTDQKIILLSMEDATELMGLAGFLLDEFTPPKKVATASRKRGESLA